jgi:hypothetical protein
MLLEIRTSQYELLQYFMNCGAIGRKSQHI